MSMAINIREINKIFYFQKNVDIKSIILNYDNNFFQIFQKIIFKKGKVINYNK